jgi:hypothetical protein
MKKFFAKIALFTILCTGCAWMTANQTTLDEAIDAGIAITLASHQGDAAAIIKVANIALAAINTAQTVTVGNLVPFVMAQVNLQNLPVADYNLLNDLTGNIATNVENYFTAHGITDPSQQLALISGLFQRAIADCGTVAGRKRMVEKYGVRFKA